MLYRRRLKPEVDAYAVCGARLAEECLEVFRARPMTTETRRVSFFTAVVAGRVLVRESERRAAVAMRRRASGMAHERVCVRVKEAY